MSFAVMGTKLGLDLTILNSEYIKTSFPKKLTTPKRSMKETITLKKI